MVEGKDLVKAMCVAREQAQDPKESVWNREVRDAMVFAIHSSQFKYVSRDLQGPKNYLIRHCFLQIYLNWKLFQKPSMDTSVDTSVET